MNKALDQEVIDIISQNFKPAERVLVISELTSLTLDHVMAQSETDLKNTRLSILKLAKGSR